jgi:hypothetical protein
MCEKIEEEVMMSDDVTQSITGLISIAIAVYISQKSVVCSAAQCGIDDVYKSFAVFGEVIRRARPPWSW